MSLKSFKVTLSYEEQKTQPLNKLPQPIVLRLFKRVCHVHSELSHGFWTDAQESPPRAVTFDDRQSVPVLIVLTTPTDQLSRSQLCRFEWVLVTPSFQNCEERLKVCGRLTRQQRTKVTF